MARKRKSGRAERVRRYNEATFPGSDITDAQLRAGVTQEPRKSLTHKEVNDDHQGTQEHTEAQAAEAEAGGSASEVTEPTCQ